MEQFRATNKKNLTPRRQERKRKQQKRTLVSFLVFLGFLSFLVPWRVALIDVFFQIFIICRAESRQ
jgi:hypothetical protein